VGKRVCEEPLAANIITYIYVLKQKEIFLSQRFTAVTIFATELRAVEGHNIVYWHKRFVGTSRFYLQGKDAYVLFYILLTVHHLMILGK